MLTPISSIEHLPEDVLTSFAPVLLGHYAPRLLLFTTPTYDFNTCFSAPGDQSWGFPDPTQRTDRIFRHSDHKFEWTIAECEAWSRAAAQEWGYEVTIDSIGRSTTKDPWGRNGDVRATQAVTFRRREGSEWATRRATKYAEWASSKLQGDPHHRLTTHQYEAHSGADQVAPREEIVSAIKNTIHDIGAQDVTIFELWREDAVSTLCGGWLEVLLDVISQDSSFLLHKEGDVADDWKVELPGVELRGKSPWQNQTTGEDAWAETSESTDDLDTTYEEEEEEEEYYEEYDDEEYWDEDSGRGASDSRGWNADDCDINTLKAWADWKPAPGWIIEPRWE
jgi:small RNA 2'-O-methyltransferase